MSHSCLLVSITVGGLVHSDLTIAFFEPRLFSWKVAAALASCHDKMLYCFSLFNTADLQVSWGLLGLHFPFGAHAKLVFVKPSAFGHSVQEIFIIWVTRVTLLAQGSYGSFRVEQLNQSHDSLRLSVRCLFSCWFLGGRGESHWIGHSVSVSFQRLEFIFIFIIRRHVHIRIQQINNVFKQLQ